MKIHFLGTAAAEGFPNPFCRCRACLEARQLGGKNIRTRSSVIIDDEIKVDHSGDANMQAIRDGIDLGAIRHVLFTHTHYDHFVPLELYSRIEGYAHGLAYPLHIYGNDSAIYQSRLGLAPDGGDGYAFHVLRPFREIVLEGGTRVTPLPADHDRMENCLLFYIEKEGKKLFYGNDTGWFPDETWAWLQGKQIDLAILDCTCGYTGNKQNPNHMGIETVLEVQRVWREQGIIHAGSQLFVTHFTHNCGLLHDELERIFAPAGIYVAYDGLIVELP
ncbi:phosphoribosyl 1,2-cyclic phosphate phosphodiesterase [Paenibacillus sp. UNCCL117]|uniref:MBL fold metallo-hydrolase n=1 Tax=unclassified Paenibacillus TaxID=185978 RepID=UPI000885A77A|nr:MULTISPECIES: MBL fold metallo-hydrolase [unclassified Paenibacillus]SDE49512.1 phosphoribosyl 1,2-cyclic phosphate phosphodiesterase [Paenibacillus sp. cl123]SFW66908.1 phosphoribosyl 1,2-cyclic phosphate phosphodiesterase [Paenibacillus sp. UNCCL117]